MKIKRLLTGLLPVVALTLVLIASACQPVHGAKSIDDATAHDFVFSVEARHDGSFAMWLRNDSVGVYCLPTRELYDSARAIVESRNPEIVLRYASLNSGVLTADYPQCVGIESQSSDTANSYTIYVVKTLTSADSLTK